MGTIFKNNNTKDKDKEKEEITSNMSTMANTQQQFFQRNNFLVNQHIDLENKNVFEDFMKQFHKVAKKQGIITLDQKIDFFVLQQKINSSQTANNRNTNNCT